MNQLVENIRNMQGIIAANSFLRILPENPPVISLEFKKIQPKMYQINLKNNL